MGTFQMPEFNFRLRRALDPFGSQDSGRKFGGVSFFNPQQEEEQSPYDTQDLPSFDSSMPDYSQMYGDTGPATKRYQQHLSEVPKMQDYAPTKWRRLGAVLTGVNQALAGKDGYGAARNVVLDPYKTAYEDWMGRGEGAKEAATLEEAATGRKATLYQKILSDYMDQRRWQADYEVKMRNAKTAEERNAITRAYNDAMAAYRNRQNELTGIRDENTRKYQTGMLGNAATANQIRREGVDVQRYGINRRAYDATKGRELQRDLGATGPISGSSQKDVEQIAMDEAYRAMLSNDEYDLNDYFVMENGVPVMIKAQLPPEIFAKYQAAKNQGLNLAGRR